MHIGAGRRGIRFIGGILEILGDEREGVVELGFAVHGWEGKCDGHGICTCVYTIQMIGYP